MADFNPELQAKLDELEQELEVRTPRFPMPLIAKTSADFIIRRRAILQRKGTSIASYETLKIT
jgi:hypothetical protein